MLKKLLLWLMYSSAKPQNLKYTIMLKNEDTFNFSLHLLAFILLPNSGRKSGFKITRMPPAGEW